jgi:hypothetical protein
MSDIEMRNIDPGSSLSYQVGLYTKLGDPPI